MAQARQPNERNTEQDARGMERSTEDVRNRAQGAFQERAEQGNRGNQGNQRGPQTSGRDRAPLGINMTATAMRNLGQLYDMQAATARVVLRAQSRAFSALGLPDYSHLFEVADDRTTRMFSTTAETLLQSANHANSTGGEIQQHLGRLWEQQAMDLTETWRQGLEELQAQGYESLNELKQLVRQQADEMAMATESLTDVTRETLREGGEQFRATVRQGFERSREVVGQQAEATRREAERVNDATRQAGEEMRGAAAEGAERAGGRSNKAA